MTKLAALGVLLTAVATAVIWGIWGRSAVVAGGLFGFLATVIHLVAAKALRSALDAPFKTLAVRYLFGMALRLGGAAFVMVAVLSNRTLFPPLPTAIGYLAVLIPLLFTEIRFLK